MIQPVSHKSVKTTFASAKFQGKYKGSDLEEIVKPVADFAQTCFNRNEIHVKARQIKVYENNNSFPKDVVFLDIHPLGERNITNRKPVWKVEIPRKDLETSRYSEYTDRYKGKIVFDKITERLNKWADLVTKKNQISSKPSDKSFLKQLISSKREKIAL